MTCDHEGADGIVLSVPSEFHLQWIREKHHDVILAAAAAAYGSQVRVDYRVSEDPPAPMFPIDFPEPEPPAPPEPEPQAPISLMGRYRFDSFVVGPSNRFAYAARSEEHTSELQSRENLVCRLLLE